MSTDPISTPLWVPLKVEAPKKSGPVLLDRAGLEARLAMKFQSRSFDPSPEATILTFAPKEGSCTRSECEKKLEELASKCSMCVAMYCSDTCRVEDKERHKPDCIKARAREAFGLKDTLEYQVKTTTSEIQQMQLGGDGDEESKKPKKSDDSSRKRGPQQDLSKVSKAPGKTLFKPRPESSRRGRG